VTFEGWLLAKAGGHLGLWAMMIALPFGIRLALYPYISRLRGTRDHKRRWPHEQEDT